MKIELHNDFLTATVNSLGAELCSVKNKNNDEFIWEGNPVFWGKHSPILFPIVGTLKNNTYQHNELKYTLSRHGFARDMEFTIIEQNQNRVTFSLQANEDTLGVYPFLFELQISYLLIESEVKVQYKVINNSGETMPFSIGAHPAFALTDNFNNYAIQFEQGADLEYNLLDNDLISNATKKLEPIDGSVVLDYELFKNDALIFKKLNSNSVTILNNKVPMLAVNFSGFPSLGIWTKVDAPFLCIEPWFGYSDTSEASGNLLEKEGIIKLEDNNHFDAEFSIEIY